MESSSDRIIIVPEFSELSRVVGVLVVFNKFSKIVAGSAFKVVVRAEILARDFLQTQGNYYLSLTIAKI